MSHCGDGYLVMIKVDPKIVIINLIMQLDSW